MATPKRRLSKIKTKIRRRIWKNKTYKKIRNALNWANFLLRNLQKD